MNWVSEGRQLGGGGDIWVSFHNVHLFVISVQFSPSSLVGHSKAVRDICYNNTGTQFLSAAYDRYLKLWDSETGRLDVCAICHTYTLCLFERLGTLTEDILRVQPLSPRRCIWRGHNRTVPVFLYSLDLASLLIIEQFNEWQRKTSHTLCNGLHQTFLRRTCGRVSERSKTHFNQFVTHSTSSQAV